MSRQPDIRIRNVLTADLQAIIALSNFVQRKHADALPDLFKVPVISKQARNEFRKFLADSTSLMLLAEEGKPAGYLWAQFQNRPECWDRFGQRLLYIHYVAVAPQFRRRGVGSLLLTRAIDIAQREGIRRVELDVWSFNLKGV